MDLWPEPKGERLVQTFVPGGYSAGCIFTDKLIRPSILQHDGIIRNEK